MIKSCIFLTAITLAPSPSHAVNENSDWFKCQNNLGNKASENLLFQVHNRHTIWQYRGASHPESTAIKRRSDREGLCNES